MELCKLWKCDKLIIFTKKILPREGKYYLALSGGVDSMAALHFLINGGREIQPVYINHKTSYGKDMQEFLKDYVHKRFGLELLVWEIEGEKRKNQSQEEFWHHCRYDLFNSLDYPVITSHHLDDAIETFIYTSMHGDPKAIKFIHKNVVRPFLFSRKAGFIDHAIKHELSWREDPSNSNEDFCARNYIRNKLMPGILKINPGIHTTVMKKLELLLYEALNEQERLLNKED